MRVRAGWSSRAGWSGSRHEPGARYRHDMELICEICGPTKWLPVRLSPPGQPDFDTGLVYCAQCRAVHYPPGEPMGTNPPARPLGPGERAP